MAKLREQRNVIAATQDFYNDNPAPKDNVKGQASWMMGGIFHQGDFVTYLCKRPIFVGEKSAPTNITDGRRNRVGALFQSCIDDNFIIPFFINVSTNDGETKFNLGVRVTSRGTDLLHSLGLIKIFLEKYDKIAIAVTSSAATSAVGYIWYLLQS